MRLLLALVLVIVPAVAVGQSLDLADVLRQTARLHGTAYAVGRDALRAEAEALGPILAAVAAGDDWRERRLGRVLGAPGDPSVAAEDLLWESVRDRCGRLEPDQVRAVVRAGRGGDGLTARALLLHLERGSLFQDEDVFVEALVGIGGPAVPVLQKALGDGEWAPLAAARALGRIDFEGRTSSLCSSLAETSVGKHRVAICRALADIGDAAALPALLAELEDATSRRADSHVQRIAPLVWRGGWGGDGREMTGELDRLRPANRISHERSGEF